MTNWIRKSAEAWFKIAFEGGYLGTIADGSRGMGVFRAVHSCDPGVRRSPRVQSIARTGAPWRDLPEEFGKWSSVCRHFRRWTLAGLWELMLEAPNESGAAPPQVQMIDSTVIRAHHQAAGAKGGPRNRFWPFKRWLHDQDTSDRQCLGLACEG